MASGAFSPVITAHEIDRTLGETSDMSEPAENCIFCAIAAGKFGTTFVAETDNVVAFDDISPQAPTHILVVPRRHVVSVRDLSRSDDALWGEILDVANTAARLRGVDESGYRFVTNAGPDSGQEVMHLHVHVLGGAALDRLG
jgi:histidine triad (HIT) family protein